jgi:CHAT domain-containing protein
VRQQSEQPARKVLETATGGDLAERTGPQASSRLMVWAASAMLILGGGLWWSHRADDAERLLRVAYTASRPFDYRLPGGHSPVKRQRADGVERPESLLRAEAEVQQSLRTNPTSPGLLLLKGRVDLLDHRYDNAVVDLVHASDLETTAPVLEALGVAYSLRAERDQRDSDFGLALDSLLRSLRADPKSLPALFNLALVCEHLSMIDDAAATWKRVLQLESSGPWADESRRHLERVEGRKKAREAALLRIAADPAIFVQRARDEGGVREAEYYQNVFWSKWLPAANSDNASHKAAQLLAKAWADKLGDRSLQDALSQAAHIGDASLAGKTGASIQDNIHGRNDEVLRRAGDVAARLRSHGQTVAAARLRLELAYSYRRATQHEPCLATVNALIEELRQRPYPWLLARAQLEHSTCIGRAGAMGEAREEREELEARLTASGFAGLALQARELVTSIDSLTGNSAAVWNQSPKNLAVYWSSPAAEAQAQQSFYDMGAAARDLGWKEAAIAMESAAVEALVRWDNPPLEAVNRVYLASLFQEAGHHEEAVAEFERADRIYAGLPAGVTIHNQMLAGRLRRAEAEAAGSAPAKAIAMLDALSPSFSTLEARMRLQQARGIALWAMGNSQQASGYFRGAIQLASEHVNSFNQPLSRVAASEMAMESRRHLVQIALVDSHDASESLRIWEQRSTGAIADPEMDARAFPAPADAALIYSAVPAGVAAWFVDGGEVRGQILPVTLGVLRNEAQEFHRLCASEASDPAQIRAVGSALYTQLIAPLGRLAPGRQVLIEADGFLAALPFAALVESSGHYFGESHPVVMVSTLRDTRLDGSSRFGRDARAVVVSAPSGDRSARFPYLPDAAREAQDLASRLSHASLIDAIATASDVAADKMAGAELMHFAGHGWSNGGNAALVLGASPHGGVRVFGAADMAARDWRSCRLAVLSACLTAAGEQRGPVNPQSLVRALLASGARRVVASRWSIDGNATAALMKRFYDALLSGETVAVAMQRASAGIRTTPAWDHPYYWAAFDVYGAP